MADAGAPAAEMSSCAIGDLGAFTAALSTLSRPARVKRLIFAATASSDPRQSLAISELAVGEALGGLDTALYKECVALANARRRPEDRRAADGAWGERADGSARETLDRLEGDLASKRSALDKGAIWAAYRALGDFYVARGDNGAALKAFVRMRDYGATPRKVAETCARVACCALELRNYAHVTNYVLKAEHAGTGAEQGALDRRLRACGAAAHLDAKRYGAAARAFAALAGSVHGASEGVCAAPGGLPNDGGGYDAVPPPAVAAYAALLAAAALPRAELKRLCVEDPAFRAAVLPHADARQLIECAHAGRYAEALTALGGLAGALRLDPLLSPHVEALERKVTDACLAQYCRPYATVDLRRMATAFGMALPDVEARVADLVARGSVAGRVDDAHKVLRAREADPRADALGRLVARGGAYLNEVRGLVLRLSCLEHDLVARGGRAQTGENRRDAGSGASAWGARRARDKFSGGRRSAETAHAAHYARRGEGGEGGDAPFDDADGGGAYDVGDDDDDDDDEILADAPAL